MNVKLIIGVIAFLGLAGIVVAVVGVGSRDHRTDELAAGTGKPLVASRHGARNNPVLTDEGLHSVETSEEPVSLPDSSSNLPNPGESPMVPANSNANTASVMEALKNKNNPERLTTLVSPAPFDEKAYNNDPDGYLSVIEPGRIYQSAQPGPGVDGIQFASRAFQEVIQGESVVLRVKVGAGDPVTFHSADMGEFENRLSTISLKADEEGFATAVFKTTTGMQGLANVLAASPLAVGQAHFMVRVVLPNNQGDPTIRTEIEDDN